MESIRYIIGSTAIIAAVVGAIAIPGLWEKNQAAVSNDGRLNEAGTPLEPETGPALFQRAVVVGKRPPAIDANSIDGRRVSLEDLRGKVVLIDFWATWCAACRAELPHLIETYTQFHQHGFEIVGVSLDEREETLRHFVEREDITWPQVLAASNRNANDLAAAYRVHAIPFTVLVGRDGRVLSTNLRGDLLRKAVKAALAGAGGEP